MHSLSSIQRKLALVLLLSVCAFATPWTFQAVLCVLIVAARFVIPALRPSSDRSSKAFNRFILYSIVVATLVILLNSLLIRDGNVWASFWGFAMYEGGMVFGARTAARLLLLSFSILLFFVSTPIHDLIKFLQERGLHPSLVLVLLLTLHFLEQLPGRIHQIFLAQQARGAPVDAGIFSRTKALMSILSPLVLSSIVESIERGTALELRGFLKKPALRRSPDPMVTGIDWFSAGLLAAATGLLLYAILRWLTA